jgi:DNA-binding NarL/FixJ family response regulator
MYSATATNRFSLILNKSINAFIAIEIIMLFQFETNNMKLLLVDDFNKVRNALKKLLSPIKGLEIAGEAKNAAEAIYKTKKLKPDLIILDISMPNGNGFEVLKEIKKIRSATKVILLTNFATEQFRKKGFELGADYFFDKSTEFEKVVDTVTLLKTS